MSYRVPADPDLEARAEARELHELELQAQRRVRLACIKTFVVLFAAAAFVFVFASARRSRMVCHEVQIRWENAPHVPPSTYTSCRTVEM